MKKCSSCKTLKPLSEFGKRSASKDGLMYACKSCWNSKNAIRASKPEYKARKAFYAETHKDQHKESVKKYKAKNAEIIRKKNAAYRAMNAKKLKETELAWRNANKERIRATGDRWRKNNPEAAREIVRTRRARRASVGGTLSTGLREILFKKQKGKCACCGLPLGMDFHLDHIIPLAKGGENIDSNIQLLRATCNRIKAAKHPIDFMQERGFLL